MSKKGRKKKAAQDSERVVRLIKKSNELVEARYKFDIWETRLFTKMLTMVRKDDEDFKDYRIYLNDVIKEFGLERSNASYERLKQGGIKLMTKIIKVVRETDEGMMEFATPIVVGVENPLNPEPGAGEFIDISFHPKMKPFLLALQSKFTMYDVRNILKLPSSYSIRIYELLKQYEKIGKRTFDLQELKRMIGAIEEKTVKGKRVFEDHYTLYGNFRQRVLLKAQKDLSKYTDISFTFEPVKKVRKVVAIVFYIFPKHGEKEPEVSREMPEEQIQAALPTFSLFDIADQYLNQVQEWGVNRDTLEDWLNKYGEKQVKRAIIYTQTELEKKTISNPGGYLASMVKQPDFFDPEEKKRAKKQEALERKQQRSELESELELLEKKYNSLLNNQIRILVTTNDEVNEKTLAYMKSGKNVLVEARLKKLNLRLNDLTVQLCREDVILRGAFKGAMISLYDDDFKDITDTYNPKVAMLKRRIRELR